MDRGRIVQIATPREVYERPATRFVADFIGIANIFDKAGRTVMLRPEKIAMGASGTVQGRIVDIAYEGDRALYRVDAGGHVLIVSAAADERHRRGDTVWLSWPTDAERELPR
jgi:ABC-type Fe3+/spermidine/putrescine transport system ATPase subunit